MNALSLFREGRLGEALHWQERLVREQPGHVPARLLLAEILLFTGDFAAVRRQLDAVPDDWVGMADYIEAYHLLINAEQKRQQLDLTGAPTFLLEPPEPIEFRLNALDELREGCPAGATEWLDEADACTPWLTGHVDGREFDAVRDADDFFGPVLEVLIDDQYAWFPMEEVRRLRIGKIESLRDEYFVPALLTARNGQEWRVHLPSLYPGTHAHRDESIRAGQWTDWHAEEFGPVRGAGLRVLRFGDEDLSLGDFTQWEA